MELKRNKLCPVCFRATQGFGFAPDLLGIPGKVTFFCSKEHSQMPKHHLEQEEDWALWQATKKAGQYLDSISKHDLRYLTKDELLMFTSIVISGFAEHRAEWFENKRHKDDNWKTDMALDDEVPF